MSGEEQIPEPEAKDSDRLTEAQQLANELVSLLIDYHAQLTALGADPENIRPIVHELQGERFEDTLGSDERNRRLHEHDDLYYSALGLLRDSEPLREAQIPVELSEAVSVNADLAEGYKIRTQVTKLGEVGAIVENIYIAPDGAPTEYRPQLWIPGAAAEKYLEKALAANAA